MLKNDATSITKKISDAYTKNMRPQNDAYTKNVALVGNSAPEEDDLLEGVSFIPGIQVSLFQNSLAHSTIVLRSQIVLRTPKLIVVRAEPNACPRGVLNSGPRRAKRLSRWTAE